MTFTWNILTQLLHTSVALDIFGYAIMASISKKIPVYTVDAFSDHPFAGNQAAVCPLEEVGSIDPVIVCMMLSVKRWTHTNLHNSRVY